MGILDILIILLVLSWIGGISVHVGGGLINLLLVVALVMFIARMARGGGGGRHI
jgi:hypothetical protein